MKSRASAALALALLVLDRAEAAAAPLAHGASGAADELAMLGAVIASFAVLFIVMSVVNRTKK